MKRATPLIKEDPRDEALQGPIQLKDPNSFEFACQQLYWIKTLYTSWNSSLHEWKEAVGKADQHKIYNRLPDPQHPYGSLDAMLKAEIGVSSDEAELGKWGGARKKSIQGNNITLKRDRGTNPSYLTGRLKRDRTDLHEKVIRGEMSAYAAAREAGFIPPTFTVPLDPAKAARRILNRFEGEPLLELARVLANHAGYELRKKE